MKYLPVVKPEVLENIGNSIVKFLLSEGKATTCNECILCMKSAIRLTGFDFDALKEEFLIPINEKCTPEIEFFEVHHGGMQEYYTTLEKAQQRTQELSEYGIDAELRGCSFLE
jgi:hypothetical protein